MSEFSVAQSDRGAERRAEQEAERQAEREAEKQAERAERQAERQVERRLERQAERRVEKQAEKQVERQVGRQVEKQVGRQIANQVQDRVDNSVVQQAENQFRGQPDELPHPASTGKGLGVQNAAADRARGLERAQAVRSENAQAHGAGGKGPQDALRQASARYHDIVREPDGSYRVRDQWLVITDSDSATRLENQGFKILNRTQLVGLDRVLVEFEGIPSDVPDNDIVSRDLLGGDFNHLYHYQAAGSAMTAETISADAWEPRDALPLSRSTVPPVAVGLIDSQVNLDHDAVAMARIRSRSFIEEGLVAPMDHGTAIASILVGESSEFAGILPQGELYAASVFYETPEIGQAASVKSLLLALDWMVRSNVKVINMSLAGPGNGVLKEALKTAADKGIIVIAAAGNNGPGAPPAYPGAYEGVIAVTAVNKTMDAYFRANRGPYIDIAAPGVNIIHADSQRLYTSSSGTSYAAPFVAAAFAYLLANYSNEEAIHLILDNALDLGEAGIDETYGRGFLQLPVNARL